MVQKHKKCATMNIITGSYPQQALIYRDIRAEIYCSGCMESKFAYPVVNICYRHDGNSCHLGEYPICHLHAVS